MGRNQPTSKVRILDPSELRDNLKNLCCVFVPRSGHAIVVPITEIEYTPHAKLRSLDETGKQGSPLSRCDRHKRHSPTENFAAAQGTGDFLTSAQVKLLLDRTADAGSSIQPVPYLRLLHHKAAMEPLIHSGAIYWKG